MKDIRILCVGKVREKFFADGIDEALKSIRNSCPVSILECPDEATPDNASPAQERLIREKEGARILSHIREGDYVIALSIDGRHYDTDQLHRHLSKIRERISGSLIFVIGGSLGLSDQVIKRADEKLSFSALTFPHQLMRLMLADQIASWTSLRRL
ncbi:MAG: 23S rRNA (pseudouridine(1915)-N(3))-methyltransferase RlmH [Eubacterium sp.]|nr:23S rRNA (pseudouridine(1915)-N(3))-methyltransferase RlmH [Eubacterium sp.]